MTPFTPFISALLPQWMFSFMVLALRLRRWVAAAPLEVSSWKGLARFHKWGVVRGGFVVVV
jgi:hypothetical protein